MGPDRLPTLNLRAAEASLAPAAFVFRTGLLGSADAGDIGYARAPLQRVHGDAAQRALDGPASTCGWAGAPSGSSPMRTPGLPS